MANQILETESQVWEEPVLRAAALDPQLHKEAAQIASRLQPQFRVLEVRSLHCPGHGHCHITTGHSYNGSRVLVPLLLHSSPELASETYFSFLQLSGFVSLVGATDRMRKDT